MVTTTLLGMTSSEQGAWSQLPGYADVMAAGYAAMRDYVKHAQLRQHWVEQVMDLLATIHHNEGVFGIELLAVDGPSTARQARRLAGAENPATLVAVEKAISAAATVLLGQV